MKSSETSEQSALIWHFVSGLFDLRGEGGGKEGRKMVIKAILNVSGNVWTFK